MIQNPLAHNQSTKCEPADSEINLMAKQIIEEIKNVKQKVPQPTEVLSNDRASIEGKFGWAQFDDKFIPYLFRYEKKYVARHMMECNVFCKYDGMFSQEIYSCFKVEEFKMTAAEARLLNEINFVHCDDSLGSFVFPDRHYLIALNDAMEITEFLRLCYDKLILKKEDTPKVCGFIKADSQNCIPYVWLECKQYIPLFYLDGECQYLEQKSVELKGWELAYMKLLCKIQGIRKPLFDHDSIRVVNLQLVNKFFSPGTQFEEFWPIKNKMDSLMVQCPSSQDEKSMTIAGKVSSSKRPPRKVKAPKETASPYSTTDKRIRTTKKNSKNTKMESSSKVNSARSPSPHPVSVAANLETLLTSHEFSDKNNTYNTYQVPDYVVEENECPYSLVRSLVGDTILRHCINLSPHNSAVLLATIDEVAENLFKVPAHLLVYTIKCLQINVYFPNTVQMKLFQAHKLYPTNGLIKLCDLLNNLDKIRLFLS